MKKSVVSQIGEKFIRFDASGAVLIGCANNHGDIIYPVRYGLWNEDVMSDCSKKFFYRNEVRLSSFTFSDLARQILKLRRHVL